VAAGGRVRLSRSRPVLMARPPIGSAVERPAVPVPAYATLPSAEPAVAADEAVAGGRAAAPRPSSERANDVRRTLDRACSMR
jgi:hypothetical protein